MNINKETKRFNDDLVKLINNSGLPAVNIYYVMKDVFQTVEKIYIESINKEETDEEQTEEQ